MEEGRDCDGDGGRMGWAVNSSDSYGNIIASNKA